MTEIEIVRVIKGIPVDQANPMWPATIFDLRSRRLRYQMVDKHHLFPLETCGDSAKFTAIWCSSAGTNGRWQLIDVLPENVSVLP
jgi:hypothetical protein